MRDYGSDITISERNADENDDSNVDRVVPAGPVLNDVKWRAGKVILMSVQVLTVLNQ